MLNVPSILTNISAMETHQNLLASSNAVSTAMERLSSGLRINNAADDAAGYAISQGLTSQVNGLDQAGRNVGDAVSMVSTAESSMNNIQSMLQRIRELAVQYQNGSLQASDKTAIQGEVDQLTSEIERQRGAVSFNGAEPARRNRRHRGHRCDLPGRRQRLGHLDGVLW